MVSSRVDGGRWERVHRGVYLIAGAPRSWRQRLLALCLYAGKDPCASHIAAGVLWGLIERSKPPVEITVRCGGHIRSDDGYVVHRSRVPVGRVRTVEGVPVTDPDRTLIDLARFLSPDELEEALDEALRRRLVRLANLASRIEVFAGSGRRGVRTLAALVASRTGKPVSGSALETRFHRMFKAQGLPAPERQHEIRRGGRLVARVDFAYPAQRMAIEVDGYRYHSSPRALERDDLRQNELQQAGYVLFRFTSRDLSRPAYACGVIRRALWERGHPEVVSPDRP